MNNKHCEMQESKPKLYHNLCLCLFPLKYLTEFICSVHQYSQLHEFELAKSMLQVHIFMCSVMIISWSYVL